MLVLSRKANEEIVLGDDVRITVLSIRGNRVRLGIQAPDGVTILRREAVSNFVDQLALSQENELALCQS